MSVAAQTSTVKSVRTGPKDVSCGKSHPLGATVQPDGVNFSVFSRGATRMELVLFDAAEDGRPSRVIPINPRANRTYHYWHVFVPGLQPGQIYGYRTYG